MSFVAGAISGGLDWDTQSFEKGFLRVEALTQTFPSIVTNFMASPMLGLVGVATMAMTGVVGAIKSGVRLMIDAFNESLENADKINDMATNVGVGVEALSGLGLAAQQAGSGVEEMADAFKFLGKNVAEALAGGKEQASIFRGLGISLKDAAGQSRPLEEIMFDLADAMAQAEGTGKRTDVAMALLGRSGSNLIATLSQGSTALREQIRTFEQYGAVVTKGAASSADAFGDLLGKFQIAWSGIKNQLAEPLRETLTPLLQDLLTWLRNNQPEVRSFMRELSRSVLEAIEVMINAIANLKRELAGVGIGAGVGAVGGGIVGGLLGGPAGIIPGIYLGGAIGGTAGGAIGYATGPVNIQLNTRPEMSDSQVGRMVREAYEQSHRRQDDAMERERYSAQLRANEL